MTKTSRTMMITGAGQRLGAVVARRLCALAIADGNFPRFVLHFHRSSKEAEMLADELRRQFAVKVTLWQQDLCAPDLSEAFRNFLSAYGPLDTLINNAAIFYPEKDKLGELTHELWEEVMTVNTWAPLCLMQEMAAALPDGARGNIINILDQRVLSISHAFPVYTASKSALWAITQNMARTLAPRIRVNAIAPGHVLPMADEDEERFRARQAKTPLGQGPLPEAIADMIWTILNSPSITGACIPMDGGEHLVAKRKPSE